MRALRLAPAVLLALAVLGSGAIARADPEGPLESARPPGRALPRATVETLPSDAGTLRRLYRPEFRSADSLLEALTRFGLAGTDVGLVAPWVEELRAPPPPPGAPPGPAPLAWPVTRWDKQSLDQWFLESRNTLVPFRVPTRLLLHGPTADVERLEDVLARLDVPVPAVAVGLTIAEVRCEARRERGGHLLFSRDAAPDSPDTFYRGTSADFEPESWIRARLTGLIPFPGTSIAAQRFDLDDGLFEYVLRGMALRQEAALLAQPCLVCTEEDACGMESVVQVPALTLIAGVPVPQIQIRPLDAGLRLGLRAVRVGTDTAVLDLRIELRTAEQSAEADALPGTMVVRHRELTTRVTVRDGESLVLGGLMLIRRLNDRRSMPVVSAVPALDHVSSARGAGFRRTELLFVLTPRVLTLGSPALRQERRTDCSAGAPNDAAALPPR